MFYLKDENGNNHWIEDNVFTYCLDCGEEMEVDLVTVLQEIPGADLYGLSLRCPECSKRWIEGSGNNAR